MLKAIAVWEKIMRILIIGGTRFIGVYLTQVLLAAGHEVVLFNRGNHPAPMGVGQIIGDRQEPAQLKEKLAGETFDAIFDNNGRELAHTQPLAEIFAGKVKHFVYVSSAGVYLPTDQPPHKEADPVDPNSRHKGSTKRRLIWPRVICPGHRSVPPTFTAQKITMTWKLGSLTASSAIARFQFLGMGN